MLYVSPPWPIICRLAAALWTYDPGGRSTISGPDSLIIVHPDAGPPDARCVRYAPPPIGTVFTYVVATDPFRAFSATRIAAICDMAWEMFASMRARRVAG